MSDLQDGQQPSRTQNEGGVAFTVPEKAVDVQVTEHAPVLPHSNHDKELFDVGRAFSGDAIQKGTIVSDRKRAHTGIGTMLVSAWNEWWGKTRHSIEQSMEKLESSPLLTEKEETKIASPLTRAEVIQKASSITPRVHDDHAVVKERVRSQTDMNTVPLPTFAIKSAERETGPRWASTLEVPDMSSLRPTSPLPPPIKVARNEDRTTSDTPLPAPVRKTPITKEEGTLDLSRRVPQQAPKSPQSHDEGHRSSLEWSHFTSGNTVEPGRETKIPTVPAPVPSIEKPVPASPRIQNVPTPPPVIPAPRPPLPVSPPTPHAPVAPEPLPEPSFRVEDTLVYETPQPDVAVGGASVREYETPTEDKSTPPPSFLLRIPKFVMLGFVVIVGVTSGVMLAYTNTSPTPSEEKATFVPTRDVAPPFEMKNVTVVPFTRNTQSLLISLAIASEASGGASEVFDMRETEDPSRVPTADQFLDAISDTVPPVLVRSLTGSYVVGVLRESSDSPYIVLGVHDFERAFGGMLVWESTLSTDLSPFFGATIQHTLVPGKDKEATTPRFTDALEGSNAVRILFDELGNERIVYTVVNGEYIIVTTSTEALVSLISLLPK